jgi:hypothetical protein
LVAYGASDSVNVLSAFQLKDAAVLQLNPSKNGRVYLVGEASDDSVCVTAWQSDKTV